MMVELPKEIEVSKRESEAIDYEIQAYFEEYRKITDEIRSRMEGQQQIVNLSALITAGAIPVLTGALEKGQLFVFLMVPLVFSVPAAMYFSSGVQVLNLAFYLNNILRPTLLNALKRLANSRSGSISASSESIWGWENYLQTVVVKNPFTLFLHGTLVVLIYGFTFTPSVGSLLVWHYVRSASGTPWLGVEITLVVIDIIVILLIACTAVFPALGSWFVSPRSPATERK
jgi:hypothetical protein